MHANPAGLGELIPYTLRWSKAKRMSAMRESESDLRQWYALCDAAAIGLK